jgi:hypothetical protein
LAGGDLLDALRGFELGDFQAEQIVFLFQFGGCCFHFDKVVAGPHHERAVDGDEHGKGGGQQDELQELLPEARVWPRPGYGNGRRGPLRFR